MTIEKRDIGEVFQLNIDDIKRDRIYANYALQDQNNYLELLIEIAKYLIPLDDYLYSDDSAWVGFFKSKIVEWFGEEHGFVIIDEGYWLLSLASVVEGIKNWDISRICIDDIESARKLVKLMSVVGEIGSSMKKDAEMKENIK